MKLTFFFFSFFNMPSVSVFWVDLYLSNDLDLSNDLVFFWFIADGFIYFTFRCLWFVCFVDYVNSIYAMGWVMASLTTLGFVSMSIIASLTILSVVMTNGFWRYDIGAWSSLPGLLQRQNIFNGKFQLVYSLWPQDLNTHNKSLVIQFFPFKYCVSHKPDQMIRSWTPYAIQLKRTTGILQGFHSLSFLKYLISFTNWSKEP